MADDSIGQIPSVGDDTEELSFISVNNATHNKTNGGNFKFLNKVCLKSLKVLYTNADCFTTSKQTELKCYIQEKDSDIIAVTEILPKTSAFDINTSYYSIDGYTQFTSDLTYGRGCVLFIKSNIPISYTNFNNTFQESVWCSINLTGWTNFLSDMYIEVKIAMQKTIRNF